MTAGGGTFFLLTDQVGSLRVVADTSGNVVKRIDYDSFGNIIADSNPGFSVPFGFAGGLHDRDTGLVRFGYRDYSPELGRFVSKDPLDFAGGDTNLYAYVSNDPVNFVDPQGLFLDTILDVGFVLYDLYELATDRCNRGDNLTALGLDLGGLLIPGVTGGGSLYRLSKISRKTASTAELIAKGRDIDKVDDLVRLFGGKARDWKKMKGVDEVGAEWHWYENRGMKVGKKRPGEVDPF
jgi:RHS repeat-associated protein